MVIKGGGEGCLGEMPTTTHSIKMSLLLSSDSDSVSSSSSSLSVWSVSSTSSSSSVWTVSSTDSSLQSVVVVGAMVESSPLCSGSASAVVAVGEVLPGMDHTNIEVGRYADVRGPHRGEWPIPVEGRRCKEFGTMLQAGSLKWNYAIHVCCFKCVDCKE